MGRKKWDVHTNNNKNVAKQAALYWAQGLEISSQTPKTSRAQNYCETMTGERRKEMNPSFRW